MLQEWHKRVTEFPSRVAEFVKIVDASLSRERGKYLTWDQLAAACVIDEAVICDVKKVRASVELHGSQTRSQMLIDADEAASQKMQNVSIVTRVNQALYEKLITAAFSFL